MHLLARTIFRGIARKKRKDLDELGDHVAEIAVESTRGRLDDGQTTGALPS
jgi:antitoxin component of MazEF toxin-antitoxin module